MEENTLELSFEVDVSEGDEEEDRNYSLDSDNDDPGDLGDFDPKLVKIKTQLSVECQCSQLHISMNRARDCWMMIKVYIPKKKENFLHKHTEFGIIENQ